MRVLVTGCAGFIGSHCCEALLRRGDEVVGIDCFDPFYGRALKARNLEAIRSVAGERFTFIEGDLLDGVSLDRAFALAPVDRVLHLAAKVGVRPSIAQPAAYMRHNIEATTHVLAAMSAHDCERLVFASSSSVYGDDSVAPYREDARADAPMSPYAVSKRACELICRTWHALHGTHIYGLRLFTVYGPRQRPEMAFHRFATHMARGEAVPMFGDGASSRDYTFVGDVVAGVLAALDRVEGFRVINIGGDREIALRDVIGLLGVALGVEPTIAVQPSAAGDVRRTSADLTLAGALLGYAPAVDLETGLAEFAAWFWRYGVR